MAEKKSVSQLVHLNQSVSQSVQSVSSVSRSVSQFSQSFSQSVVQSVVQSANLGHMNMQVSLFEKLVIRLLIAQIGTSECVGRSR